MIDFKTISELFLNAEKNYKNQTAFKYKNDNKWHSISHSELHNTASLLAYGLNNLGLEKDTRILLLSENRIEWIYFDAAFAHLGITNIPVFPTSSPKQLEYIINHSECSAIVVSSKFQLKKIEDIRENIPTCKYVISIDDIKSDVIDIINYNELIASVNIGYDKLNDFIEEKSNNVSESDLLTIIYTSGTTGNPKGVMLSHKNMAANIRGAIETGAFNKFKQSLSYLPLCHAYERMAGYYVLYSTGCCIALCESVDLITSYAQDIKPELMTTVPKLMETIRTKILNSMLLVDERKRKLFYKALEIGEKYVYNKLQNKTNLFLTLKYKIFYKLIFSKIKEKLGGRLEILVSGGAAMNYDTAIFFEILGVKTLQGYGLTEASPVISINLPGSNEPDSVGKPFFNVEVKIAEDGEILCKGDNVMVGYLNEEVETNAAIDVNGWLHTGDIGEFTKLGNIKITDRKKNIFVTSSGKNIAPQPIENQLLKSIYSEQVFLIGEAKEYCTALIYPNFEQLEFIAKEHNIKEDRTNLIKNDEILKIVKKDIDRLLKDFSKFEQVRKIKLLENPFSVEGGELSHKMSVKRHFVEEKYKDLIESMYI